MPNSYTIDRYSFNSFEPDYVDEDAPSEILSGAKNVRYENGSIKRSKGYQSAFNNTLFEAIFLIGVRQYESFQWVYAGESALAVVNQNGSSTDLTPVTGVSASIRSNWTGGVINGLVFLANSLQTPIYWDGLVSSKFQDLPGWQPSTTTKCIRSYKNFLIALGIDGPSGTFGNLLKWSSSADTGDIPQSWDVADPTLDAGEAVVSTIGGNLVDCLPLGDANILYKDDSTHIMNYVGGQFIFSFADLFTSSGIMGRDCAVEINGTHIVLTKDDLIQHNGNKFESIVNNRIRMFIFQQINHISSANSYLCHNRKHDEVWVCIPTGISEVPDLAIIWNYKLDKFGTIDLPNVPFINDGFVDIISESANWDDDSQVWDDDDSPWSKQYLSDISNDLLFPLGNSLFQADTGDSNNGLEVVSFVEKRSIRVSPENEICLVVRLLPNILGTNGDILKIKVGGQMDIGQPITWASESDYVIGKSVHHDCLVKGRYVSIKISSVGGMEWELHSVGIEYNSNERY